MSRQQTLINEIRARLDELESLLNPATPPTPTVAEPQNFQFSDSILRMNETVFKITPAQRIELCEFISTTHDNKINIKRFIEKIDPSRCRCYCLVKEIDRRKQFLTEGENLYYDETKNKYYSQCRMPSIPNNNNYCNRHTNAQEIDISRMKILTNDTYNLTIDSTIKSYCMSHLPNETQVAPQTQSVLVKEPVAPQTQPAPIKEPVAPQTQSVPVEAPVEPQKKPAPAKKEPVAPQKKPAPAKKEPVAPQKKSPPIKKAPVVVAKLKENSDIESSSNSENESSSSSDSEVDMIVSKVSESLKAPVSEEESGSEAEDSDDCMLDADEIHDEEGNTYYIDEAKSVIKLDEEGYGERLGMLKEFKSGNLFYKNKRWKIEYFPKK
jgi:hypothetical protein